MTTPLDHARDLIARGFAPIPVPIRQKGPRVREWQTLRIGTDDAPQHFGIAPSNVGVLLGEPSGWIVDVDLDHARAVALADAFLPPTGTEWGRESKPRSHRLYRLTRPTDTRKWASKAAGMIVELRSTGCQTIAPGSVHPNGETVRWDADGEPASIDPAVLIEALDRLASAVRAELGESGELSGASVPRPVGPATRGIGAYAREALRREAAAVASAANGTRNDTLNRAAFNVGTLIGGGELDWGEAEAELLASARTCGLRDSEARRTVRSGIGRGIEHPRQRPAMAVTTTRGGRGDSPVSVSVTRQALASFVPFPLDSLPEPVRGFVSEAARAIGCDPAYVVLPLLAGLASAVGNTHRIALKRSWSEPCIFWTATVAESGSKKSPPIEMALAAIFDRQHRAMKEHAEAMREYADALAIHERDAATWKRSKSGGDPPAKPEAPIAERCWTDDATTEALAVMLQQNPRGLLMRRDELAGWFNFDRYTGGKGGGDVAKWLEMFGGRALMVDRKGGATLYVPRAAVSLTGSIQPATLRRALGEEHRENGLAARLLFAMPPRLVLKWTEAEIGEATKAAVGRLFNRLFGLTMETDDDGDERPRLVTLDGPAKAAWVTFYNEHATEQAELSGDVAAAWSKLEGYAARLALLVHLVRWAAGDRSIPESTTPIDAASVAAGVTIARWFGAESRRVYAVLSEGEGDHKTRELLEWIERRGGTVTARDLTHGVRAYRGDAEGAERALAALVKAGIGRWETDGPGPKGGRPARRFRLASSVTVTKTPTNVGNDLGNGDGDAGTDAPDTPQPEPPTCPDGWPITVSRDTFAVGDAEEWGEV